GSAGGTRRGMPERGERCRRRGAYGGVWIRERLLERLTCAIGVRASECQGSNDAHAKVFRRRDLSLWIVALRRRKARTPADERHDGGQLGYAPHPTSRHR